jgi:AAR2 protein
MLMQEVHWPGLGFGNVWLPCVQARRYRLGVQRFDFDSGLAPYPMHMAEQWKQLSAFISSV